MIARLITVFVLTLAAALPARAAVEIQEVTSPGGITAWLVEEQSIPFAAIEIRFRGGAALDLPGKGGATNLMAGLLEEGSGDLDAQAFAREIEALAASFSFDVFDDAVSVSARFLTENRAESVALLRDVINAPRFDDQPLERVRAQVLSGIQSDLADPNAIARTTFDRLAFGDHPYGRPREGTVETVTALTREDLLVAHRNAFTRDRVFVGAVGDITAEELGEILDLVLGDLPLAEVALPGPAGFALEGGQTVVSFQTPQAVALFGHGGIPRDDPDFFAAFVANEIFGGGGFNSRLMEEVRRKRGLTYGIGSYLATLDQANMVMASVATVNERMAETIAVVRDEWERLATEGVTEEELEAAKTYLTGAYPLRFDGNGPIARILVGMQFQGLPIDYIATRNDKVEAVTLEDVKRVAARVFRPEDLHVVIVGEPDGLDPAN